MKKYHYHAIFTEEDVLRLTLHYLEETEAMMPTPLIITEAPAGSAVYILSVDTLEYRELFDNSAVKKTLTISAWLNKATEYQTVNFNIYFSRY